MLIKHTKRNRKPTRCVRSTGLSVKVNLKIQKYTSPCTCAHKTARLYMMYNSLTHNARDRAEVKYPLASFYARVFFMRVSICKLYTVSMSMCMCMCDVTSHKVENAHTRRQRHSPTHTRHTLPRRAPASRAHRGARHARVSRAPRGTTGAPNVHSLLSLTSPPRRRHSWCVTWPLAR